MRNSWAWLLPLALALFPLSVTEPLLQEGRRSSLSPQPRGRDSPDHAADVPIRRSLPTQLAVQGRSTGGPVLPRPCNPVHIDLDPALGRDELSRSIPVPSHHGGLDVVAGAGSPGRPGLGASTIRRARPPGSCALS